MSNPSANMSDTKRLTVIDIVAESLRRDGFGGLVAPDGPCGCELDDLAPCGGDISACRAGYRHADPRPDHPNGWAIWPSATPPSVEQWSRVEY